MLEILLVFAGLTLAGLTLVGAIGGAWLLFAKWGHWRLLLSTLAPCAVALAVGAFAVVVLVDIGNIRGIPDLIEVAVVLAAITAVALLLASGVVGLAALIDNRRWGVLATLTAVPGLLIGLMLVSRATIAPDRKAPLALTTTGPAMPASEAAAVRAIATDAPATPHPDEFAPVTVAPSPDGPADETDGSEERPDWVDNGSPNPNQAVHSAGPSVLLADAERDAWRSLARWAWDEIARDWSDTQPQPPEWWYDAHGLYPVVDRFEETRETSVGTVHFVHLLGGISPQDRVYWEREIGERLGASRSVRNTRYVALGGAGVLALLGVTHLVLRRGAEPNKHSEPPPGNRD